MKLLLILGVFILVTFSIVWIRIQIEEKKIKKYIKVGSIWELKPKSSEDNPWYKADKTYVILDVTKFEKDRTYYVKYRSNNRFCTEHVDRASFFLRRYRLSKEQTTYDKLI